jgi:hypothetical protein
MNLGRRQPGTNIAEGLAASIEADAKESAKERAAKEAADAAVRERAVPAITDVRAVLVKLEAQREHRPAVRAQVQKYAAHRVLGQSRWLTAGQDFLRLTDPSAPDYQGAGCLERLADALAACDSTTPRERLDWLLQVAGYVREWPRAAAAALDAFVVDLPAVEAAEARRLEIEARYEAIYQRKAR